MSKTLSIKPRLSEKTYGLSESHVYVVDVPTDSNKHSVARAIEAQFEVKVSKVRIANIKGKKKRTVSITGKRYQNSNGKRNNIKKAYVTLLKGHALPFFAAVEEEQEKENATQQQIEKAMDKQAQKDAKPKRSLRRRKNDVDQESK
jgi:large subunit ribosomal protein L23